MTDRAAFGTELRRSRERRGLSLDQLAEVTKISASLFAGLERGDLSRWPSGIFRRAFVRSYAQAVGLDPEETLARFVELFPEADDAPDSVPGAAAPPRAEAVAAAPPSAPRLLLDESAVHAENFRRARLRSVAAPVVDLFLALVPAVVAGSVLGWRWAWVVGAAVAALGHLVTLPLLQTTPGGWVLLRPALGRPVAGVEPHPPARRRADAEASLARRHLPRHPTGARAAGGSRGRRIQH